jgi:hypothetical protein
MNQEIVVETKGQLMAAVLTFNVDIPTTIILKRKSGITLIEHKWTPRYNEVREYHPIKGYIKVRKQASALENATALDAIIRGLRTKIRKLPAKELLA